jgi:hypothetical protein
MSERSEVLAVVRLMKMMFFWVVAPCKLVGRRTTSMSMSVNCGLLGCDAI